MYVNQLKENISYHTSCLTIAIIVCKDQDNLHSSIKVFGKIIYFFLKLIVGLNVSVFLLLYVHQIHTIFCIYRNIVNYIIYSVTSLERRDPYRSANKCGLYRRKDHLKWSYKRVDSGTKNNTWYFIHKV